MNILYNVIVPEISMFFCMMCNHVTMTVKCDRYMTVCGSNVILTSNSKSKNKKINENENRNKNT